MLPRILLVEDSEDDAFFLERALAGAEIACQIDRARNGNEALDYFQQILQSSANSKDEPAAVLLDLKMPGMSGFQVLEWIDNNGLRDRWPIIVLSGSDQAVDIQRALRMGASAYLVKPPTAKDMRECLLPRLSSSHQTKDA